MLRPVTSTKLAQLTSGPNEARNHTFIAQPKTRPQTPATSARPTARRQTGRSSAPVRPARRPEGHLGRGPGPLAEEAVGDQAGDRADGQPGPRPERRAGDDAGHGHGLDAGEGREEHPPGRRDRAEGGDERELLGARRRRAPGRRCRAPGRSPAPAATVRDGAHGDRRRCGLGGRPQGAGRHLEGDVGHRAGEGGVVRRHDHGGALGGARAQERARAPPCARGPCRGWARRARSRSGGRPGSPPGPRARAGRPTGRAGAGRRAGRGRAPRGPRRRGRAAPRAGSSSRRSAKPTSSSTRSVSRWRPGSCPTSPTAGSGARPAAR